ncbi:MAG: HipA domain-containing protein [Gordonia sp. (in: high G+C Gram-positive bacteria)]|uniref:type II toxin-antitoxin system HipA family toxin n=1 Tax=Gordonia sp. (in: high G+C Gram-positive bacteria) TaxID=84139 RepID=UPI0039E43CA0
MTSDTRMLRVTLHGRVVGHLRRHGNVSWFDFDEQYLADPDRPVLGLNFEENPTAAVRGTNRLPVWFSNLLPEGVLREWIARDLDVSVDREFELLAHVGHDLPGAAVFTEVDSDDRELPTAAVEETGNAARDESSLWRFSLAGVELKFSMLRAGERFTCPAHGADGDWIAKLPGTTFPGLPANEFAMMSLARAVGIDVPEIRMVHRDQLHGLPANAWRSAEEWAYAVKRFDRNADGSRKHIEDLAQIRSMYPDDKYLGNYETVAGLLYRGHDIESLREFARRLALFVVIGNGDAHLKNWSVLYSDPRSPRISPAYDIVATAMYNPDGSSAEQLSLKLNGARRFESIRLADFERVERKLHAQGAALAEVVRDLIAVVPAAWEEIRAVSSIDSTDAEMITRTVAERCRQLR